MKKQTLIGGLVGLLASFSLSQSVLAADNSGPFFGKEAAGNWIIGVKLANIDPNVPDVKDATGTGIVLGYEFAKSVGEGTSTFELEYIAGDEEQIQTVNGLAIVPDTPTAIGTYEADIVNAYFTYRSPGDLYYKVKGGVSFVDLNVAPVTLLDRDYEDVSLAVGIGLGYRVGDLGVVELEYTQDSGDADVGTLGLNGLLQF